MWIKNSRAPKLRGSKGALAKAIPVPLLVSIVTLLATLTGLYVAYRQADIMDRQTKILMAQAAAAQVDQVDKLKQQVVEVRDNQKELLRLGNQFSLLFIKPCSAKCAEPLLLDALNQNAEGRGKHDSALGGIAYTRRQLISFMQDLDEKLDVEALARVNALWMPEAATKAFQTAVLRCPPSDTTVLLQEYRLWFVSQMTSVFASNDALQRQYRLGMILATVRPRLRLGALASDHYSVGDLHTDLTEVVRQMQAGIELLSFDCNVQQSHQLRALHSLMSALRSHNPGIDVAPAGVDLR